MTVMLARPMRGVAVTGVVGTLVLALAASAAAKKRPVVHLGPDGPKPSIIVVAPGTRVRWVNGDAVAHALRGDFSSPTIPPGGAFVRRFRKVGEYRYQEAANSALRGTVVVTGGTRAPPPPSSRLVKHRYRVKVTLFDHESYRFYDDRYHGFRGPCNGEVGGGKRFERLTVDFAKVTYAGFGRTEVLTGHSSRARVRRRELVDAYAAEKDSPLTTCPDGASERGPNRHVHCEGQGPRSAGRFDFGWTHEENRMLLSPIRTASGRTCGLTYAGPLGLASVDAEALPLLMSPQRFAYDTATLGPLQSHEITALRKGRPVTISREMHLSWLASCCTAWVPQGFGGVLARIGTAWTWDAKMKVRLTPR